MFDSVQSTLTAAKLSLSRALDAQWDMSDHERRYMVMAYDQVQAALQMIEVDRGLCAAQSRAADFVLRAARCAK